MKKNIVCVLTFVLLTMCVSHIGVFAESQNIALGKPVTAGMWKKGYEPARLTDGDETTFVYPDGTYTDNEDGQASSAAEAWYIVDLEGQYKIDGVKIVEYGTAWTSKYNVKILASNDKKFETGVYTIINSGTDGKITLNETIKCNSNDAFGYVKIQKIQGSVHPGFHYAELEVYPKGIYVESWETNNSENGTGTAFETLEDVSVGGIKANVLNYENSVVKLAAVAVLYDPSGKLTAMQTGTATVNPNMRSDVSAGVKIPSDTQPGSVFKGFLWNITDGVIVPVGNAKSAVMGKRHNIYVASNGSDDGRGTIDSPYKSIEKAKEAVKSLNTDEKINVYIREGVYCIEDTLVFDETDGRENYITYSAYDGEDVTISGGRKIEGWSTYDGNIVRTPLSGVDTVRELYVNGKKATRAKGETPMHSTAYYYENGDPAGLIVEGTDTALYGNPQDIQLRFDIAYRNMIMNVESISADGNTTVLKLQQPQFKAIASDTVGNRGITHNNCFYMENAYELLDKPGEFYYDKKGGYLYYVTDGENVENAYVPVLEKLIEISGSDYYNKVKNICFKDLKFAHSTDKSVSENGLIVDQAQRMITVDENGEKNYTVRDAAIQLKCCDGIQFIDNTFTGISKVCLGLYNGASNSIISGNAFYDTGDSAITVGTEDDAYTDTPHEGRNLALRRPTTGTSPGTAAAVDGNAYYGWSLNEDDCTDGDYRNGYLQIDLGDSYKIDCIEIDARKGYNQPTTRANFEVVASNDPDFAADKMILARCGATAFENEGTWTQNTSSKNKYRYVRVRKTADEYFFVADIRVINKSMTQTDIKEICKNNSIYGNCITRIGNENHSAPGIVTYYSENTEIKHNYIYDVPYSGISSGWGWTNTPNSVTNKNNVIEANIVERYCMKCIDGAGIYTLGNQPGCKVLKNVVRNQVNVHGAIYPDDGTIGLDISQNIVENACTWLFIWSDNKKNITASDNYTSTPRYVNAGTDCTIENTTYIVPGKYTGDALTIYENAGLQNKDTIQKIPTDEKVYTFDELYTNIMYNSGMSASAVKGYYLTPTIEESESIYNLYNSYCENSISQAFYAAIEKAKATDTQDLRAIIEAQLELKNARDIFINSTD